MSDRYKQSEELLQRAKKIIPGGAQTFSKSPTQFPLGVSPYFISHGKGCHVWDVDGNRYIDLNNALAAITLGHADPDVELAVKKQLAKGTIYTLSNILELEVAERIIDMVPCAEMVRFGKNGSDATTGAIRLARAITSRDYIAVCGYHGWHDWYIGSTTRDKGVPAAVKELTLRFHFNDILSLEALFDQYPGQIAAVIMEPMNTTFPQPGFLEKARSITRQNGTLLIFDETVTGFRLARGGAQELFGITPDLATFGKGLANGFPLSAIAGPQTLMKELEKVFFSFTFGGETLSLAAAKTVLDKLTNQDVLAQMHKQGRLLSTGTDNLLAKYNLDKLLTISGHPVWSFLLINASDAHDSAILKTFLLQETLARGVLTLGSHNISYSLGPEDVESVLSAYDQVFALLEQSLQKGNIKDQLHCSPITPLFTVR